ncbi:uncharacterized protein LOC143039446 isoform X2 [Oratosquilla oratoria]|uniref:uncharacterized protein LOC143039446 isoform X2 n=1 Tax=Oratosquilla oratoria TaxID=337810 RepID=UPI003F77596F
MRKRSAVWTYFDNAKETSDKVLCQICGERIMHSGNTSNMLKHLKIKHPEEYKSIEIKPKKQAPGTSKTSRLSVLEGFRKSGKYPGGNPSCIPVLRPAEKAIVQLINPGVVYGIADYLETESDSAVVLETCGTAAIGGKATAQTEIHF